MILRYLSFDDIGDQSRILHYALCMGDVSADDGLSPSPSSNRLFAEGRCLDGIFEAFFESYWVKFCNFKQVSLKLSIFGSFNLKIVRRFVDGSEEVVAYFSEEGGAHGCSQLYLIDGIKLNINHDKNSYIFVKLKLYDKAKIDFVRWESCAPPINNIILGGVITTYNREDHLEKTLRTLSGRLKGGKIIVVNHGAPNLSKRMGQKLDLENDIIFVEQENSGGAGGFTRGINEHLNSDDVTHFLLMDDDIIVRGDLFERIAAILSYVRAPLCIGGAMLDFEHRHNLFSAGDCLAPGRFGIDHLVPEEGCDLRTRKGVDFLGKLHQPDFNGWWCFTFPRVAIDSAGLPMPCFIRGDDVEYGYRLARVGWPTTPWPGIAVWHKTFEEKSQPWHMFYDRRNSLWANALHKRLSLTKVILAIGGGFFHHLLRYDYNRVAAMLLGVDAFCRGVDSMASWRASDHARLVSDTSVMSYDPVDPGCELFDERLYKMKGAIRSIILVCRFMFDIFIPFHGRSCIVISQHLKWRPDFNRRPSNIIVSYKSDLSMKFEYSWVFSVKYTIKFFKIIAKLVFRRRRLTFSDCLALTGKPELNLGSIL